MAGYSQTPLIKKLGIKKGYTLYVKNSPVAYESLLGKMPEQTVFKPGLSGGLDFIHYFTKSRIDLEEFLQKARSALNPGGMIWVSWPKKSSKVKTDITEDVIRQICLPMDLVDVKVCAIDDVWSGLKLMRRKAKKM